MSATRFGEQAGIPYSRCGRTKAPYKGMKADLTVNFQRFFREVMEICKGNSKKAHILMVHVPQFIAFMYLPLGFTIEQVGDAQDACCDALYQRYRTTSETSSTYSLRH